MGEPPQGSKMSFEPAEVFSIEDAETFELLADPTRHEIIELVMTPRSVTEIAEAMRVPRTRLYHHVKLLEEAGMITVVETRQVGAIQEKVYQVSAKSFRPSEAFLATSDARTQAEAVMAAVLSSTRADFVRAADEGLFSLRDDKTSRKIALGRRFTRLRPEHLHDLVTRLEELLEEFDSDTPEEGAIAVSILHVVHPSSRR